jgi:cell division protein FtsW (lipid II flippase)
MGARMTSLIVPVAAVVLLAAAVFEGMQKRVLACWLLASFPGLMCIGILRDLARGPGQLGEGAFGSDQKQLVYCAVLLGISLLSALPPVRWWLFWVAWLLNAAVIGVLIYLLFFWKVFS